MRFFIRLTPEERNTYKNYLNGTLEMADLIDLCTFLKHITKEERDNLIITVGGRESRGKELLGDILLSFYRSSAVGEILDVYTAISQEEREYYDKELSEKLSMGGRPFIVEVLRRAEPGQIFEFLGSLESEERKKYFEILKNEGVLDKNLNSVEDYIRGIRPGDVYFNPTRLRFWMGKGVKPEERNQYREEILEYLRGLYPDFRILFLRRLTPEERKSDDYKKIIEETLGEISSLEKIPYYVMVDCVKFFSALTPEERQQLFKGYLERFLRIFNDDQKLEIFRSMTPEERKPYRQLIKRTLDRFPKESEDRVRFLAALSPWERES
jgi:hypothetical protein